MNDIEAGKEIRTAIKQGEIARVVELIGTDAKRLQMDTPFGSWLHVAASTGQLGIVEYLISIGGDINRRAGVFDGAPINEAASAGYIEVVRYLLEHGAKLDISEPERNPMFAAIYGGHLAIVKLLIDSGIDVHVKYTGDSMKGMDAVAFAKERGQREIALFLQAL